MALNRRQFLFASMAATTLPTMASPKIGLRPLKPGEKRTIAMIGCGLQMRHTLIPQFLDKRNANNVKIVAVCDCDKTRAATCASLVNKAYKNNDCKIVSDFLDIIKDPTIDMVCIGTPDHWHAYMCVEAMKHGKDVYCEKPLTWSVQESNEIIKAEAKYGRIFQTGSMQRSSREFRDAVALVRGGLIGNVYYIDANFGNANNKIGGCSQPMRFWNDPKNAAKEGAPNKDIDWTRWLGPATLRPYSDQLAPRGNHRSFPLFWRCDDDLASGYCGDWGAHHLDIAQWGLDMDKSGPEKVICSTEPHSTDLYHGGRRQFGAKMLFKKPYGTVELQHGPFGTWGTIFYGEKGIVAVNRGKIGVWTNTGLVKPTPEIRKQINACTFMPEKMVIRGGVSRKPLNPALGQLEKVFASTIKEANVYNSAQHVRNFCECVESRKMPITSAEVGGRASILCVLMNMSYKYDIGFDWDPVKMEFANGTGKGLPLERVGDCNGWKVQA
jgi:predicted dehydrogenase